MATPLEDLEEQVARNRTVSGGAIQLLNGLAKQIEENKNNPAKLQELANNIRADVDGLAAAVVANTPGQPPTEPPAPPA